MTEESYINIKKFYFDIEKLPNDIFVVEKFSALNDGILSNAIFTIDLITKIEISSEKLIGGIAVLRFQWLNEDVYHRGIVSRIEFQDKKREYYSYQFTLSSLLEPFNFISNNREFNYITIPELIKKLFIDFPHSSINLKFQLNKSYLSHDIVVQYHETTLEFINRLLRAEGIGFVWRHYSNSSELIFFDTLQTLPDLSGNSRIPYVTLSNQMREMESIWSFLLQSQWSDETNKLSWKNNLFFAESDCMSFSPGLRFILDGHPQEEYNRAYRVLNVKHFAQQATEISAEFFQEQAGYHNQIICIPDDVLYHPEWQVMAKHYEFFTAHVVALHNNVPLLNQEGRYCVELNFAQNEKKGIYYPLRLMQPYYSNGAGWHFPLRCGTEVLITFIGGDLNFPIMMGAIPNAESPSPVLRATSYEHNMITQLGNQFRFIDNPKDLQVLLSTPENLNYLRLQAKCDVAETVHKVELVSEQGQVLLSAGQQIIRKSTGNHTQTANQNYLVTVAGNAIIASNQQSVEYYTSHVFQQQSESKIFLQTKNALTQLLAKNNFNLSSQNTLQINVKQNDFQLFSKIGDVLLGSAKCIILMADQQSSITLQQKSNTLQHTESNQTLWSSKIITVNATNINIYSNESPHNNLSSTQASGVND